MSKPLTQFIRESVVGGNDPWTAIKVLNAHNKLLRREVDELRVNGRLMLQILQVLAIQQCGRFKVRKVEIEELPPAAGLAITNEGDQVAVEFIPEKVGL